MSDGWAVAVTIRTDDGSEYVQILYAWCPDPKDAEKAVRGYIHVSRDTPIEAIKPVSATELDQMKIERGEVGTLPGSFFPPRGPGSSAH
jgi:hypothetical protein